MRFIGPGDHLNIGQGTGEPPVGVDVIGKRLGGLVVLPGEFAVGFYLLKKIFLETDLGSLPVEKLLTAGRGIGIYGTVFGGGGEIFQILEILVAIPVVTRENRLRRRTVGTEIQFIFGDGRSGMFLGSDVAEIAFPGISDVLDKRIIFQLAANGLFHFQGGGVQ